MVEPVNLNRYRKQKMRAGDKVHANENVARFSRSKTQKQQDKAKAGKSDRDLDGHELDE